MPYTILEYKSPVKLFAHEDSGIEDNSISPYQFLRYRHFLLARTQFPPFPKRNCLHPEFKFAKGLAQRKDLLCYIGMNMGENECECHHKHHSRRTILVESFVAHDIFPRSATKQSKRTGPPQGRGVKGVTTLYHVQFPTCG